MQAIVLAGGAGARPRQVLGDTPTPMAPVCSRPFLYWSRRFRVSRSAGRHRAR